VHGKDMDGLQNVTTIIMVHIQTAGAYKQRRGRLALPVECQGLPQKSEPTSADSAASWGGCTGCRERQDAVRGESGMLIASLSCRASTSRRQILYLDKKRCQNKLSSILLCVYAHMIRQSRHRAITDCTMP